MSGVYRRDCGVIPLTMHCTFTNSGGMGHALSAILEKHPKKRGTLFDLEKVITPAREYQASRGLADRIDFVCGSFFDPIDCKGADAGAYCEFPRVVQVHNHCCVDAVRSK